MNDFDVVVKFGPKISSDLQGRAMLQLERMLRELGAPANVFKETMPDDSKLRSKMTPLERGKL